MLIMEMLIKYGRTLAVKKMFTPSLFRFPPGPFCWQDVTEMGRAAESCAAPRSWQRCVDACDPGATTGKPTLTCELSAKPTLTCQDAAPSLPTREAAVTLQAARA